MAKMESPKTDKIGLCLAFVAIDSMATFRSNGEASKSTTATEVEIAPSRALMIDRVPAD